MNTSIKIQTEGGGPIGLGHVMRSITLASVLGAAIEVSGETPQRLVFESGVELTTAPADVLIRDFCTSYPSIPRGTKFVIDLVDETWSASGEADLTFAFLGENDPSKGIFSGLEYAILRPEFAAFREEYCYRENKQELGGIIVTLGGVDPSQATSPIITDLTSFGFSPRAIHGIDGTRNMAEELGFSTLAITSCGLTLLEAGCVGTPTLAVSHNEREHRRAVALQHHVWFHYLGPSHNYSQSELSRWTNMLSVNSVEGQHMRKRGMARIDGLGAQRVASIIIDAVGLPTSLVVVEPTSA